MKVGVSAFAWRTHFDKSLFAVLPGLREGGIEAFEFAMFDPAHLDASAIRREMEKNDLQCTVCAILPANVNPISSDAAARASAMTHLKTCIQTAVEMGATLVGGPIVAPIGYLPPRRHTAEEARWAAEYLHQVTSLLDSCNVTLCIEPVNRSESMFVRNVGQARAICEAVAHPRVGITVDTFHANIEEKSIPAAVLEAGKFMKHVHASENDRGPLGSGHVDFPGLIAALNEIGYQGLMMIEGFGYSPAVEQALGALLADPGDSPDQIAYGGAAYLRSLLAPTPNA